MIVSLFTGEIVTALLPRPVLTLQGRIIRYFGEIKAMHHNNSKQNDCGWHEPHGGCGRVRQAADVWPQHIWTARSVLHMLMRAEFHHVTADCIMCLTPHLQAAATPRSKSRLCWYAASSWARRFMNNETQLKWLTHRTRQGGASGLR